MSFEHTSKDAPASPSKQEFDRLLLRLSKASLHAAERGRRSLFLKLTAANAERIAELSKEKPNFVEQNPNDPTILLLEEEIRELLPTAFFDDPTGWLESQPIIKRPEVKGDRLTAQTISELWEKIYDITRVKEFSLQTPEGEKKVVSKRLSRADIGIKEVAIHRKAYEAGLPTVKIYGEVIDKGNTYLLMEKFSGVNLEVMAEWLDARSQKTKMLVESVIQGYREHTEQLDVTQYGFQSIDALSLKGLLSQRSDYEQQNEALHILSDLYTKLLIPSLRRSIDLGAIKRPGYLETLLKRYWHCASLEEFVRFPPSELYESLQAARKAIIQPLRQVEGAISRTCYEQLFHSPQIARNNLEWEAEKLNKLCQERGVTHSDLFGRNILVEWDFEKNNPVYQPDGSLSFRIIDWEPIK